MKRPLITRREMFFQEVKADLTPLIGQESALGAAAFPASTNSLWLITPVLAAKLRQKGETVEASNVGDLWCRASANKAPWNDDVIDTIIDEELGNQQNPGKTREKILK